VDGSFDEHKVTDADLRHLDDGAAAADLRFKYYPVAHIGTDRCGDVIVELRRLLEQAGASLRPDTELIDLTVDGESKIATLRSGGEVVRVRAGKVVLAMGKVGASRQARLCRRLGMSTRSLPMYVGVRFETNADLLTDLFSVTKDPKYSAVLPDGSKVKTHCASDQGEVIELRYSDLPLAGGHNYSHAKSGRSGFSILWNGFAPGADSYRAATEIMAAAGDLTGGRLLVQKLSDYRSGTGTRSRDLEALELSCPTAVGGDARRVLPSAFFDAMDTLLGRLEAIVPGFVDEEAVIYAPAIEWWMERIVGNDHFLSEEVPGLAVCGDGSGWSQGIVHAAATGLLAAEGLAGGETRCAALSPA
jgi:uncharacterized FAD-dependent dehydrogenase